MIDVNKLNIIKLLIKWSATVYLSSSYINKTLQLQYKQNHKRNFTQKTITSTELVMFNQ